MLSHRGSGTGPARARSERGETLVEVMVAIVLMGGVMAAILGGLFALVSVSNSNQEKTKTALAVQSYAEQVKEPVGDLSYVECTGSGSGTTATYQGQLALTNVDDLLPPGYSAAVDVQYWQGGSSYGTCPGTGDLGLQRFVVTIDNGRPGVLEVVETLLITKRNAVCPTQFDNPDAGPC